MWANHNDIVREIKEELGDHLDYGRGKTFCVFVIEPG
jgi:hypothetical protein